MKNQRKVILDEKDMPKSWYNLVADLPSPPEAMIHPGTKQPVQAADMTPLFPMALLAQEMSSDRHIDIPAEVRDVLFSYRPSPLVRARQLEKALDTPAHIYYKWEGVSPAGSHKVNTAIPQAFYNMAEGTKRIATETGAGQWGSSLAFAGGIFGIEVKVYMVKVSYDQKPYRRILMETWGAKVVASPSSDTDSGRKILSEDPNCSGSLGIAISEAVEDAAKRQDTKYALGSVLNHVILHQTIIGQETMEQLSIFGEEPDVLVACHGGGSNFAGFTFPFVGHNLRKGTKYRCVAVEPASCPSLTKGKYAWDFGDVAGLTPIMKMHTLGHDFVPPGIHAGGLRYHGAAPLVSKALDLGLIEARSVTQIPSFEAAVLFARTEGFLPAPESSHAIRGALEEAIAAKEEGKKRVIVFNLSGHGHFDLTSYQKYLNAELTDHAYSGSEIEKSLAKLPTV